MTSIDASIGAFEFDQEMVNLQRILSPSIASIGDDEVAVAAEVEEKTTAEPAVASRSPSNSQTQSESAAREHSVSKWLVLVVASLSMFSIYYCYDNPAALQNQMMDKYDLTNVQYNLLYSAYSFPNMLVPFFVGVLADMFGITTMMLVTFGLVVIGHGIFITGCIFSYYPLMITGRVLFGLGSENYQLSQDQLLVFYFNDWLGFALAFKLSCARVGSAANDYLTYLADENQGLIFAISVGFVFVLLAFSALLTVLFFHSQSPKRTRAKKSDAEPLSTSDGDDHNHDHHEYAHVNSGNVQKKVSKYPRMRRDLSTPMSPSYALPEQSPTAMTATQTTASVVTAAITDCNIDIIQRQGETQCQAGEVATRNQSPTDTDTDGGEKQDKFRFSDLKLLDFRFWCLAFVCSTIYGCIFPFMNIGSSFLQSKHGYSHGQGNMLLMIPYTITAFVMPAVGWYCDKYGHRAQLLVLSCLLLIGSHSVFAFVFPAQTSAVAEQTDAMLIPIAALVGFGAAFSIFGAVIWPSFSLVVPPKILGTGYGIPYAGYNSSLAVFFIIVGVLTDSDADADDHGNEHGPHGNAHKYDQAIYFLLGMSCVSLLACLLLLKVDRRRDNALDKPIGRIKA